jgi:hypothetical protein
MSFAEELRASLNDLFASGAIEIRESCGRTTPSSPISWEVRGATDKPLLHLWAENCNVTRRVVAIADQSEERVMLAVERFGRSTTERLELVRLHFKRNPKQISREDFCGQLRRILSEKFPDEIVEKLSVAPDLEHSLSGMFVRGIFRKGQSRGAFLAVQESETPDAIESSLTYALLWLERARQSAAHANLSLLRLIVPDGKAALLTHQLGALDPSLAIQIFELNLLDESVARRDPVGDGNVSSWLVPRRECELLLCRSESDLAPIVALEPAAISARANPNDHEVVLRFRGLPFVRWKEGKIDYWTGRAWRQMTAKCEQELKRVVQSLKAFRGPLATNLRHPLYRSQPERWMQSIVTQDVSRIDSNLDPEHVYEQVIAQSGGRHGILDLLTVTRAKRLAILELKANENPGLPLQAADYWKRIHHHQSQGDLPRYGYFPGMQLQSAPPLLYLVAPALRFHPTTDTILRYLSPEIEIIRAGLAESWRRGLRVVMRQ